MGIRSPYDPGTPIAGFRDATVESQQPGNGNAVAEDSWNDLPVTLANADLQKLLNVGPGTVSKWLKAGTIPAHRIGSTWITFRCDVTAWLASTASTPTSAVVRDPHPLEAYPPLPPPGDLETLFGKRRLVINRWLKDGTIRAYRVGSRWLIEKTAVHEALRATATNFPAN